MATCLVINEKAFRQLIIDASRRLGWLVYFTWNSLHSPAGFPDLILVRDVRMIAAELKTEKGKPTAPQLEWLDKLSRVDGVETHLWKPSNWEQIVEILR